MPSRVRSRPSRSHRKRVLLPPPAGPDAILLDLAPWLETARVHLLFARILGELTEAEHFKLDAAIGAAIERASP